MNLLKLRDSLMTQVVKLNNLTNTSNLNESEIGFYQMLYEVGKSLISIIDINQQAFTTKKNNKLLLELTEELINIISEIISSYEIITTCTFEKLSMKHVYEQLEDQMASMDDWIEDFNECHQDKDLMIPYIEAWDVSFFFN